LITGKKASQYGKRDSIMSKIQISLFTASIRPNLYKQFFDSLKSTQLKYEVIFTGPVDVEAHKEIIEKCENLKFIVTGNVKPAQCYEIARRNCTGELIHWTADDAEYSEGCLDKAYEFWKGFKDKKTILSIQTKENGTLCDMDLHSFQGADTSTPLMAPLGLMSRKFLDKLGGCDARYICGQYENDIVMRAYAAGAQVYLFKDGVIELNHYEKHGVNHEGRTFALGYTRDRQILEKSWGFKGELLKTKRSDEFVPFTEDNIMNVSQHPMKGGPWV